jgi:hypothetical protein
MGLSLPQCNIGRPFGRVVGRGTDAACTIGETAPPCIIGDLGCIMGDLIIGDRGAIIGDAAFIMGDLGGSKFPFVGCGEGTICGGCVLSQGEGALTIAGDGGAYGAIIGDDPP